MTQMTYLGYRRTELLQLDARERLVPRQVRLVEGHDVALSQIGHGLGLRRQPEIVLDRRKRRRGAAARREIYNITVHVPEACVGHSRRRVDDVNATCRFEFCTLELARRNLKGGRHGLVVRRRHRRRVLVRDTSHIRIRAGPKKYPISIARHALSVVSEAGDAFDAFERREEAQRRRPEGR